MSTLDDYKADAKKYMEQRDYGAAIRALTEAIEIDKQDERLYLSRGLAYYMRRDFDLAIEDLTAVLLVDAQNLDALLTRGNAYLQDGDIHSALADYTEYINIAPASDDTPYARRAAAYAALGQLDAAIADYGRAIDHAGADMLGKLYYSRSTLRYNMGDYRGTIDDCTRAIDHDYRAPEVYSTRGSAYSQLQLPDEAIRDYSTAIDYDLRDITAWYNRGAVYYQKGELAQAIDDFGRAIALQPDSAQGYYARAIAYADQGDYRNARLDLTQVLKLQPQNHAALHKRAYAYRQRGKPDKALRDYQSAVELLPNHPPYLASLGEMYLLMDDTANAIGYLKRAIIAQEDATAPLNDRILAGLAVGYARMARPAEVTRYWQMLLDRDPNYADVDYIAGRLGWEDDLLADIAAVIDAE